MIDKLIPIHVARAIASSNRWCDGDTWVIGNGRVVEYELAGNRFILIDRIGNTTIGSTPFANVMSRGRERVSTDNHGPRSPEEIYEDADAKSKDSI